MLKRSKTAKAVSDRSGFVFPMSEMVIEPGTGWLVHKSESDGKWSLTNHPLNNLDKYLKGKTGDPFPVYNARPRPLIEKEILPTHIIPRIELNSETLVEAEANPYYYIVTSTLERADRTTVLYTLIPVIEEVEASVDGSFEITNDDVTRLEKQVVLSEIENMIGVFS